MDCTSGSEYRGDTSFGQESCEQLNLRVPAVESPGSNGNHSSEITHPLPGFACVNASLEGARRQHSYRGFSFLAVCGNLLEGGSGILLQALEGVNEGDHAGRLNVEGHRLLCERPHFRPDLGHACESFSGIYLYLWVYDLTVEFFNAVRDVIYAYDSLVGNASFDDDLFAIEGFSSAEQIIESRARSTITARQNVHN